MNPASQERFPGPAFTARSRLLQAQACAVQKLKSLFDRNQQASMGTTASNAKRPPDTKTFLLSEIHRLGRHLFFIKDGVDPEALDLCMSQRELDIRYGLEGAGIDAWDRLEIDFVLMRIDLLRRRISN